VKATQIAALVRTDLILHVTNRRALFVSILVPIIIASFFGYLFGNSNSDAGKLKVAVVDNDASSASQEIAAQLAKEPMLAVQAMQEDAAHAMVASGKVSVAVVLPKGFAANATRSLFHASDKPHVLMWFDPSQSMGRMVVEGLLAEHGMQVLTKEAFSGATSQSAIRESIDNVDRASTIPPAQKKALHDLLSAALDFGQASTDPNAGTNPIAQGLSIPYQIDATGVTSRSGAAYNSYAHSYAGMAVQFILFAGIDAGVTLLLVMERGIWLRLRCAPLSKGDLLLAKGLATALISFLTLVAIYAAAMLFFGVRIEGSVVGFVAVAISFCILNASFGLALAALGRTPAATRGFASMIMILLVMLGGAWIPAFVFPAWLQKASLFVPTRWAVDGFDAMTWRGLDAGAAIGPVAVMLGTAALCLVVTVWRMPWNRTA
jgi:ABC-2 type transport system permease protein